MESTAAFVVIAAIAILVQWPHIFNCIQHDSALTGHMYTLELLRTKSNARFLAATRMSQPTFLKLLALLTDSGGLAGTKRIGSAERLSFPAVIFFFWEALSKILPPFVIGADLFQVLIPTHSSS